jgi:hypothetical protein
MIVALMLAGLFGAAGCNAIYFYETDKVSLTVEVRPDSTGPVQGNFGLKQRVVAFVPKRNGSRPAAAPVGDGASAAAAGDAALDTSPAAKAERAAAEATAKNPGAAAASAGSRVREDWKRDFLDALADQSDSDAMDVLSSLRFHKLPKPDGAPWYKVSHMTIDSALITGGAARHVANPGQAIAALSGQVAQSGNPAGVVALNNIYQTLKARPATDVRARELVGRLDALVGVLPEKYAMDSYSDGATANDVTRTPDKDKPLPAAQDFRSVAAYWSLLEKSASVLHARLVPPGRPFTVNGQAADVAGLAEDLAKARALRDAIRREVGSSAAARDAVVYFAEIF